MSRATVRCTKPQPRICAAFAALATCALAGFCTQEAAVGPCLTLPDTWFWFSSEPKRRTELRDCLPKQLWWEQILTIQSALGAKSQPVTEQK